MLYDVYYTGTAFSFTAGKEDNGYVARYAVAVHNDLNDAPSEAVTTMNDTLQLRRWRDQALLLGYTGTASDLYLTALDIGVNALRIAEYAFTYNNTVQTLVLGAEITQIQNNAFYACSALREVVMYCSSLQTIEYGAFSDCELLRRVELPNSVTEIGPYVFQNCFLLESVTMPRSLEKIGSSAFENCRKLLSVTIPANVKEIQSNAFYGCEQLFEVYDLSTALNLKKGSTTCGYAAYYAKVVYTSTEQHLTRTVSDGFTFVRADNTWYLYTCERSLSSGVLIIPEIGSNVTVLFGAIADLNVSGIVIPKTVTAINAEGLHYSIGMSYAIYYAGDESNWALVSGTSNTTGNVYYYSPCVHAYGKWTYVNGGVSTEQCALSWSVTKEATCTDMGVRTGKCVCGCGYYETESIPRSAHQYHEGICTQCGKKQS